MAKPIKSLELHYPMTQFVIKLGYNIKGDGMRHN